MFKTIGNTLRLLGLLATALASLDWWRRQAIERRHPEKARCDGDDWIHRRKGDDVGGEN